MTIDYAPIVTALTTQLGTALTAGLGVMGIILGVQVGIRFFKSFTK
jgi:hypothetical protein